MIFRRRPQAVILFDVIEKARSDVFKVFHQMANKLFASKFPCLDLTRGSVSSSNWLNRVVS